MEWRTCIRPFVVAGALLFLSPVSTTQPHAAAGTETVAGIFEGRTPCGPLANGFTGFPSATCEKIKWRLTLRRDESGQPSTYLYEGTRTRREGRWRIDASAGSRAGVVYRLADEAAREALALLAVDDNVLLLLDGNLKALVGDASWSYVLNRTGP